MQTPLRVLSINFPFKRWRTEYSEALPGCTTFSDFDVVVIRPHSIRRLAHHPIHEGRGLLWIDGNDYACIEDAVAGKFPEMVRFLDSGGLLVVILDSVEALHWELCDAARLYLGESRRVTNYDFLDKQFAPCVHNGCGAEVSIVEEDDPFSEVVRNSAVRWTAFIDRQPLCPLNNPRIFARIGSDAVVGASLEYSQGSVVFLPNFDELDEDRFLTACRRYLEREEATKPPDWVCEVNLPFEDEVNSSLTGLQFEIRRLQEKRSKQLERYQEFLPLKMLLYENKLGRLAAAVRMAFEALGFQTTPPEVIPPSQLMIHGRTKNGLTQGVFEVAASDRQIPVDVLYRFASKLDVDRHLAGIRSKGILVGNGFCEEPPNRRSGTSIFSPEVLQLARDRDIALVNSVELYRLVCDVLSEGIPNLEAIRQRILCTSGYVDIQALCVSGSV